MKKINNKHDLDKALERSNHEPIIIFKYSSTCPMSGMALAEVEKFEKKVDVQVYQIKVQDNRPESDQVASVLDLKHETPQIILVNESHNKQHLNHEDVTEDNLFEMMMQFE